MIESEA